MFKKILFLFILIECNGFFENFDGTVELPIELAKYQVSIRLIDSNENDKLEEINKFGDHICGGALISENFVLTSAYCVNNISKDHMIIIAGYVNLNEKQYSSSFISGVNEILIHEYFNQFTRENDIALIKLNKSIGDVNLEIARSILLPSSEIKNKSRGVITGWNQNLSNHLLAASIIVSDCDKTISKVGIFCGEYLYSGSKNDLIKIQNGGVFRINDTIIGFVINSDQEKQNSIKFTDVYTHQIWIKTQLTNQKYFYWFIIILIIILLILLILFSKDPLTTCLEITMDCIFACIFDCTFD